MKAVLIRSALLLPSLLFLVSPFAQASLDTKSPFTLSEALQIALARNPAILEARYRYEGTLAAAGLTRKSLLGYKFSGNFQWSPDQRGQTLVAGAIVSTSGSFASGSAEVSRLLGNGDSWSLRFTENRVFRSSLFGGPAKVNFLNEATLTYNRPLITLRRRIPRLTISVSELEALAAYWTYVAESNRIAEEVARAFAEWVRAENLVEARKAALDESELTLKSTNERIRLGAAPPLERDFAESSFYQRELEYNAALSSLASARDSLESLLQIQLPKQPPKDWDDLSENLLSLLPSLEPEKEVTPSVEDTPAVLSAAMSAESTRLRADQNLAERKPNFNLFVSVSAQGVGNDHPRAWETLRYASWFVGLQYEETLGLSSFQRKVSDRSIAAAEEFLRRTLAEIQLQLKRGYRNLSLSESQIQSARAAFRAAESSLKGTRSRYDVGMATLLDVLRAEADLLNARLTLIDAIHNRILAIIGIAALKGSLVSPRSDNGF